ncbi:MAG: ADP-ribosylglycohydrolase family protein [Clostridiales bacterium]|nr:ADP-ribosylglycohydrolase family protein [Clostridiales bacterium]
MDKEKMPQEIRARVERSEKSQDRIRGCLLGGAIGDALGYPVEFMYIDRIHAKYGDCGITEYEKDPASNLALFSDDTQMSLFTANGLLYGQTLSILQGKAEPPRYYVYLAYLDWLETQRGTEHGSVGGICWLSDIKDLWSCRAPGGTCLDALSSGERGSTEYRINHSKGCGGVMRVAPVGLFLRDQDDMAVATEGAEIAALTHSHSLGFMPAAFLAQVIKNAVNGDGQVKLTDLIDKSKETISAIFAQRKHLEVFINLIDRAVALAGNDSSDEDNIAAIGAGWCGDEALAISLYAALRHEGDFSSAIIAAVNHSGDSDSTGAITGNIVGAMVGYSAIEEKWKADLELRDVLLEMADDLCFGCLIDPKTGYEDEKWRSKYVRDAKE